MLYTLVICNSLELAMKQRRAEKQNTANQRPSSAKERKAVRAYFLENAKQSFYAEGIQFSNEAWVWYNKKTKNA